MNYWPPVDGTLAVFEGATRSSSEIVREVLGAEHLVKSFNHMGYHELDAWALPPGDPERRALAVAGDDPAVVEEVAELVDAMGFDPLALHPLSAGRVLQPGSSDIFGANLTRADGEELLRIAPEVPVRAAVTTYPLEEAQRALEDARAGRIEGSAVLVVEA